MKFSFPKYIILFIAAFALATPVPAEGARASSSSTAELKRYIEELKKNPGDQALREKIIKMVAGRRKQPHTPEEAERGMARGTAFAQRASDNAGYMKAIAEFQTAADAAPWLALAYYNLGVVQEMAGMFTDAIRSLKLYLLAAPRAKNAREVKNKIYELEAEAEAVQAGMTGGADSADPDAGEKKLSIAGGTNLEIESDNDLRIIKMPKNKKEIPNFSGNWYFKERIRDEDVTIHAFSISKGANGDLTIIPPKRVADSYATIKMFRVDDRKLKLQMKWKMRSVVGYWKTETYILSMSADGTKLVGSHNQRSVGGRNIDMDRVLFRQ